MTIIHTQYAINLKKFLAERGYEAELRFDYSGRLMYNKTTTAVVTNATPIHMEEMESEMEGRGIEISDKDNMGMDYIYY